VFPTAEPPTISWSRFPDHTECATQRGAVHGGRCEDLWVNLKGSSRRVAEVRFRLPHESEKRGTTAGGGGNMKKKESVAAGGVFRQNRRFANGVCRERTAR